MLLFPDNMEPEASANRDLTEEEYERASLRAAEASANVDALVKFRGKPGIPDIQCAFDGSTHFTQYR